MKWPCGHEAPPTCSECWRIAADEMAKRNQALVDELAALRELDISVTGIRDQAITSKSDMAKRVEATATEIYPLLAGQGPEIVGGVLADLVSLWLASHVSVDSLENTQKYRDELFEHLIKAIRELVPVQEKNVLERVRKYSN
jgi:hypothetical protein